MHIHLAYSTGYHSASGVQSVAVVDVSNKCDGDGSSTYGTKGEEYFFALMRLTKQFFSALQSFFFLISLT